MEEIKNYSTEELEEMLARPREPLYKDPTGEWVEGLRQGFEEKKREETSERDTLVLLVLMADTIKQCRDHEQQAHSMLNKDCGDCFAFEVCDGDGDYYCRGIEPGDLIKFIQQAATPRGKEQPTPQRDVHSAGRP